MSTDPRIEAACESFYNDPTGMTNWKHLASADPTLAGKYRASMTRALAAADTAATITERGEFQALPNNTVVEDCSGDVGIISNGYIWYPETAAISLQRASKRYLPARVIHWGTK